jgi:CrcB protein
MTFVHVLFVGIGGFLGALARFSISQFINKKFSFRFPVATLSINLLGSFLLGLIIGGGLNHLSTLLLGTGFMGAFTTFSTLNLEGIQLHLSKKKKEFLLYYLLSYGGGILIAFIGIVVGQNLS